ncbi:putative serine protease F56F10.1 [Pieris napi]|uniref:putative serine protease F56F10.1 n=1 Tax=Pieris napi TaxID=78633 RepID=UPI001FBA36F2|nr:putative serine protease F56F10.1 [Pieris napi]
MLFRVTLSLIFVFLLPMFLSINGSKEFRLGRSKGGNLGAPAEYAGENLPPAQWFQQKLDHSSPTDQRVWEQRYFVNDSFYNNKTGPIFLMVGGEGPANPMWMTKGAWITYAKKFKALCIMLEHRYYGESHPTKDMSTKNLEYLSSFQALADIANFVDAMNVKYENKRQLKWVAFGGSYPGSLVAWLRVKYPHLIFMSVSSSGPLLAKLDFQEYFEVVQNALLEKTSSKDCTNKIKAAHRQIVSLMQTNPSVLDDEFRTCKPLENASRNDIRNFFNGIANDVAGLVQYNEDNRITNDYTYNNLTINSVCDMLTEYKNNTPAYKALASFNSMILDQNNETCMDYSYDNMIQELRNVTWDSSEGGRQWMYQTCTEFGFYQTSTGEEEMFGNEFSLDFFIQQCIDVFGKNFNEAFIKAGISWTNMDYGALAIRATRVIFVHGSVDPWHALGMRTTAINESPVIYIPGTAHCADMYPARDSDLPELTRARDTIESRLAQWLQLP